MLNMDMIGYVTNSTRAFLYHGSDITYPQLWQHLADSLTDIGITGYLSGTSGGSDHYPFQQNGYNVVFCIEYDFSSVYHTYRDSTTYINYNYFRRMVQATFATGAAIDDSFLPSPWLAIDFPNGVPDMLAPLTETKIDVTAQGLYGGTTVPGSGQLYYSIDGGSYSSSAMVELEGGLYEATVPGLDCGHSVEYYVSVDETTSGRVYAPDPGAPFFAVVATEMTAVFEDDFEQSNGWTVSGDATDGQWQRGVPAGGGERGDPPTDYDGSGSCYLTDNVLGNSDVDGGTTNLFSPVVDLQGRDAVISYARWYSNDFGSAPFSDVMEIFISNNAGADWVLVETVGPFEQASGGWFEHAFVASDFVAPTDEIMVMFSASDLGDGSVVEAAIDAFSAAAIDCISYVCGDADGSGGINLLDVTLIVNYLYREGVAPDPAEAGDANGDGGVNLLDVTHLINYLYKEGPEPICP
ncbi:MAG: M28 family peptidase [Candidatus Zixiibacteriota bacterium]|nr:MAG: M28 family peptidase [candidate division Zixibacteria bacterium]